jgi:hypothetical protein
MTEVAAGEFCALRANSIFYYKIRVGDGRSHEKTWCFARDGVGILRIWCVWRRSCGNRMWTGVAVLRGNAQTERSQRRIRCV